MNVIFINGYLKFRSQENFLYMIDWLKMIMSFSLTYFTQHDSERKYVNTFVITLTFEHFWSHLNRQKTVNQNSFKFVSFYPVRRTDDRVTEEKETSNESIELKENFYRWRSRRIWRRVFGRTTTFPLDVIVVLKLRCSRRNNGGLSWVIEWGSSSSSRLILDKPKSATTTCPFNFTKQFELFKSRWMMLHECKYSFTKKKLRKIFDYQMILPFQQRYLLHSVNVEANSMEYFDRELYFSTFHRR